MKLISDTDFDYHKFNEMLETAVVTFSMVSLDDKTFKIANKEADIVVQKIALNDTDLTSVYYICYNWTPKDTNKTGSYIAEFKIDFLDPNCGSLIVPIREKLYVHVQDSITKTQIIQ